MRSGIYQLIHIPSGQFYIGGTQNFRIRFRQHLRELARGSAATYALRALASDGGAREFRFELLDVCKREDLKRREIYWIEALKPTLNYNGVVIIKNGKKQLFPSPHSTAYRRNRYLAKIAADPEAHRRHWEQRKAFNARLRAARKRRS